MKLLIGDWPEQLVAQQLGGCNSSTTCELRSLAVKDSSALVWEDLDIGDLRKGTLRSTCLGELLCGVLCINSRIQVCLSLICLLDIDVRLSLDFNTRAWPQCRVSSSACSIVGRYARPQCQCMVLSSVCLYVTMLSLGIGIRSQAWFSTQCY